MKTKKEEKLRAIKENYIKLDIFSVDDIKRKHTGHWFDKDSMRFFKSKVLSDVFCSDLKAYFVSSESFDGTKRFFTVRAFNTKTKEIETIGEFNKIESRAIALSAALDLAYNEFKKEV